MEKNGRVIAIISYLTIIGFIIALMMNKTTKSRFATFHLRQAFGIAVMLVVSYFLRGIHTFGIGFAGRILAIATIAFLILGILSAIQSEEKPLPIIGEYFQEWFSFIS